MFRTSHQSFKMHGRIQNTLTKTTTPLWHGLDSIKVLHHLRLAAQLGFTQGFISTIVFIIFNLRRSQSLPEVSYLLPPYHLRLAAQFGFVQGFVSTTVIITQGLRHSQNLPKVSHLLPLSNHIGGRQRCESSAAIRGMLPAVFRFRRTTRWRGEDGNLPF